MAKLRTERNNLTPKQERFAQLYIELGNASEAYRQSYDTSRMKPTTVNRNAKAMLDNTKIAARIEELREQHRARHNVTVDSLTDDLDEDRAFARAKGSPAAAVSATLGKAKLHGLLKDRHEHAGPGGAPSKIEVVFVKPGAT